MVLLAWFLAYWFRFDLDVIPAPFLNQSVAMVPLVIIIQVTVFGIFGLHRGAWRFTSLRDISVIAKAVFVGTATVAIAIFLLTRLEAIPRSVFLLHGVLLVGLLASTRILYRAYRTREIHRSPGKRILIVGAGTAGGMLIRDMLLVRPRVYEPVGFLDDDLEKKGSEIQGVRVLDVSSKMPVLVDELRVEQVLLAIPSATSEQMRRIVEFCDQSDVAYITLPRVEDILDGTARLEDLRKIKLDDLLGRESVSLDDETLIQGIAGKRILVTGGGGSIGSELCRQLAHLNPKEMVLLGRHEFSLYAVQQEIKKGFPDIELQPRLGDVCDEPAVRDVFSRYSPDLVFHAAAYKHVPMLQEQARETIRNNVIGTEILSRIAGESGCKTFVLVSTDKAVNPSSMMGASKRLAEMLVQARNVGSQTSFITVRLGNVLGSTGSVVPLFEKQILEGGPVTVTHPEVTRFLMTRAEACQLVLQACVIGRGGERDRVRVRVLSVMRSLL